MVYREIKQAVIDIETMFSILSRKPEIEDRPGAPPLKVSTGAIRFDNVSFAYEPSAADPERFELRGCGRAHRRHRRTVGRGQVDDFAAAVPFL